MDIQQQLLLKISGDASDAQSALNQLSNQLQQSAGQMMDALSGIEPSFTSIIKVAGVALGAVTAITGAIVALGVHGSEIDDVTAGFQRLAGGTQQATDILDAMRAGVVGTIDDMKLMTDANHLLATGAVTSADDFGTLTEAARVLSREGFGTMQDMIQGVSRAMETGRSRRLALMGVTVDTKGAEQAYAKSLGITAADLSTDQKLHADRQAILAALNKTVKEAGDQELSFAEKINSTKVAIENWFNALSGAIAQSPVLSTALDGIKEAFNAAFGGDSQNLINEIVDLVEQFADKFVGAASTLVTVVGAIGKEFIALHVVLGDAAQIIDGVALAFEYLALGIAKALNIASFGKAFNDDIARINGNIDSLLDRMKQRGDALQKDKDAEKAWDDATKKVADTLDSVKGKLDDQLAKDEAFRAALSREGAVLGETNLQLAANGRAHEDGSEKTTAHQKAVEKLLETLTGGGQKVGVVVDAFKQLTDAQKNDMDVQAQMIPIIDHLLATHQKVPQVLSDYVQQAVEFRDITDQMSAAQLIEDGLTLKQIKDAKAMGDSEADIARQYGVTVQALKEATEWLQTLDDIRKTTHEEALARQKQEVEAANKAAEEINKSIASQVDAYIKAKEAEEDADLGGVDAAVRAADRKLENEKAAIYKELQADSEFRRQRLQQAQDEHDREVALAQGTSDDVVAILHKMGRLTQDELQEATDKAKAEYETLRDSGVASWDDIKAAYQRYVDALKAQEGSTEFEKLLGKMNAGLQTLQSDFTALAQVSGNTFGGIVKDIAQMVGEMKLAADSVKNFQDAQQQGNTAGEIGGVVGMGTAFLGATAPNANTGTGKGQAEGALSGAASGAEIGALAGPIGMGVGAAVGAVVGFIRNLGPSAAELAGRKTEATFEQSFGGFEPMLAAVGKAYVATGKTSEQAQADVKALLDAEKQGPEVAQQWIDKINGVVNAAKQLGPEGEAAAKQFGDAFKVPADALAALSDTSKKYTDDQKNQLQEIANATMPHTAAAAAAMASSVVADFGAMLKNGVSFQQAVSDISPSVGELSTIFSKTGQTGGEAFDQIKGFVDLASDSIAGPALTSTQNLIAGMKTLDTMGLGNKETFSGLANQIGQTFTTLTGEGKDGNTVLVAMRDQIQTVWEEQQKYGFTLDDTTQKLVDQATQQGIVGPKMEDVNKQLLDVLNKINDTLQSMTGHAGDFASALNNIPRDVTTHIQTISDVQGAQTQDIPSFDNRPMERVTSAGYALLHPGDLVGVPKAGMLGGASINIDASGAFFPDRQSLQDLATMVADALHARARQFAPLSLR